MSDYAAADMDDDEEVPNCGECGCPVTVEWGCECE